MTWKKIICWIKGHDPTGRTERTEKFTRVYCARCDEIMESYYWPKSLPPLRRAYDAVPKIPWKTPKRKIRGLKPKSAFEKRMWKPDAKLEEED